MAGNKKPRKKYHQRNNERQTLRTMPSVMKWVLEPLEQMLEELRSSGCLSIDHNDMPLFLDRHTGTCFPLVAASKGMMIEFAIMFDKYHADKTRLALLQVIFDHVERDEGITEEELGDAEQSLAYIRRLLGGVTVREYRELYGQWHAAHQADAGYSGVTKCQVKL